MVQDVSSPRDVPSSPRADAVPEDLGHPRGTLAIVIAFGVLFALAWLGTYFLVFLTRGAPHH